MDSRAAACLGEDAGDSHGIIRREGYILGCKRLEKARRQCQHGGRFDAGIAVQGCGDNNLGTIGSQIARWGILSGFCDRARTGIQIAIGY